MYIYILYKHICMYNAVSPWFIACHLHYQHININLILFPSRTLTLKKKQSPPPTISLLRRKQAFQVPWHGGSLDWTAAMKWRNSVSQQTYPATIKIQIPSNIRRFCRLQSLQVEKLIQISFSEMLSFYVVFPCLRVEYFKFGLGACVSFRDFLRAPKGFGW